MGAAEVAAYLGVSRQRVNQLANSEEFPPAATTLQAGRIWIAWEIRAWKADRSWQDHAATGVEEADHELVTWLLDTTVDVAVGDDVSTIAAAIKEARVLTGRDPKTGSEPSPNPHAGTWAGALVWFIVLEQLATCFRPASVNAPSSDGEIADALAWYAQVRRPDARELDRLRDRFAHDYSLEHPTRNRRYRLTGRPGPLLRRDNTRPEVSLHELANSAERAVSAVRSLGEAGQLHIALPGGNSKVERRFSMVLEAGDAPSAG